MLDFLCMLPVDTQTQTQPARSKKRGKKTGRRHEENIHRISVLQLCLLATHQKLTIYLF